MGYLAGVRIAVTGIVVFGISYSVGLGALFTLFLSSALPVKIPVTLFIIAPLAFFMGMPFPLALSAISENLPALVPWVWGVNGCASVISAILAMILAMHFGFTVVIVSALMLYLTAMLLFAGFPLSKNVNGLRQP
jgi:hypothetical protein